MQQLRRGRDLGERRERGETEECEPPVVVRIVGAVVAVDAGAIEKVGMLDEKDTGSGARDSGLVHPRPFGVTTESVRVRHPRELVRESGLTPEPVQAPEGSGCG